MSTCIVPLVFTLCWEVVQIGLLEHGLMVPLVVGTLSAVLSILCWQMLEMEDMTRYLGLHLLRTIGYRASLNQFLMSCVTCSDSFCPKTD